LVYFKTVHPYESIVLIFKNFVKFKLKKQRLEKLVEKFRDGFVEEMSHEGLRIASIVDASNIPFNGCKNKKKRRRPIPLKKSV